MPPQVYWDLYAVATFMRLRYRGPGMARHRWPALRREIGRRLRELRLAAGISSQEKLAELAGADRTYIGRLERGESGVTVEGLSAILGAMSVSLAEFFGVFTGRGRGSPPRRRR